MTTAKPQATVNLDLADIYEWLSRPFPEGTVKFKPGVVSGNKCLPMAFIDARDVSHRLNTVLGLAGWDTRYKMIAPNLVQCRLRLWLDGRWIAREDVGDISEQPSKGDQMKSAFSDALKRAAVHFGVGAYLYKTKLAWVDYDPVKRRITGQIRVPESWKIRVEETAIEEDVGNLQPQPQPQAPVAKATKDPESLYIPNFASGKELKQWLITTDQAWSHEGHCQAGDLLNWVAGAAQNAGVKNPMSKWTPKEIELAIVAVHEFESQLGS